MSRVEGNRESLPVEREPTGDPIWDRLEDQLRWYDRKSLQAQRAFKRMKLAELVVAAAVPVIAAAQAPAPLTVAVAAIVLVLEGTQHLYQWQTNWMIFRVSAEALASERILYLAQAGPYINDDRHRVLAERVENLTSEEHARWAEARVWARAASSPGPGKGEQ